MFLFLVGFLPSTPPDPYLRTLILREALLTKNRRNRCQLLQFHSFAVQLNMLFDVFRTTDESMSKMNAGGLTFKQKYGFLSVVAMVMALSGLPSSTLVFCSLLILMWLFLGGHRTIYLAYHTLGRDLR